MKEKTEIKYATQFYPEQGIGLYDLQKSFQT